ncbi:hypothetical protein TWF718_005312 [Orbilia javanica]|uniref:Uncharacterized protein n=1 Tax=Orbilia javanica TaxID=47235 RepID=A0AAN8RDH1_9PEZI
MVFQRETKDLKASFERELKSLKVSSQRELESVKASSQKELKNLKVFSQAELEKLKKSSQRELERLKASSQRELEGLKIASRREIEKLKASSQKELEEPKASFQRSERTAEMREKSLHNKTKGLQSGNDSLKAKAKGPSTQTGGLRQKKISLTNKIVGIGNADTAPKREAGTLKRRDEGFKEIALQSQSQISALQSRIMELENDIGSLKEQVEFAYSVCAGIRLRAMKHLILGSVGTGGTSLANTPLSENAKAFWSAI